MTDEQKVRIWSINKAMELNSRREIEVGKILDVAETFEKFVIGGKTSTDFWLGTIPDNAAEASH